MNGQTYGQNDLSNNGSFVMKSKKLQSYIHISSEEKLRFNTTVAYGQTNKSLFRKILILLLVLMINCRKIKPEEYFSIILIQLYKTSYKNVILQSFCVK